MILDIESTLIGRKDLKWLENTKEILGLPERASKTNQKVQKVQKLSVAGLQEVQVDRASPLVLVTITRLKKGGLEENEVALE